MYYIAMHSTFLCLEPGLFELLKQLMVPQKFSSQCMRDTKRRTYTLTGFVSSKSIYSSTLMFLWEHWKFWLVLLSSIFLYQLHNSTPIQISLTNAILDEKLPRFSLPCCLRCACPPMPNLFFHRQHFLTGVNSLKQSCSSLTPLGLFVDRAQRYSGNLHTA